MTPTGTPALIVIPDPALRPGASLEGLAAAALAGGADALQLRVKGVPRETLIALGERLADLCRPYGALLFINDDPEAALACGAHGVHVGPEDAAPETARRVLGPGGRIGVSVYGDGDVRRAGAAGADYVAVGAVYPTRSKKISVVGTEELRRVRAATPLPIVAIGGLDASNSAEAVGAGADAVAVISAVSAARDPEAATRELRAVVVAALEERLRPSRSGE